jgi:hypothetical protein
LRFTFTIAFLSRNVERRAIPAPLDHLHVVEPLRQLAELIAQAGVCASTIRRVRASTII